MIEKKTGVVLLAAGSGKRMQSAVKKQYLQLGEKPLITYALEAFEKSPIEQIVLVVSPGDEQYCKREIVDRYHFQKVVNIISGGVERYHSVFNGLCALKECEYVLIHDGARPFVTQQIIMDALEGAKKYRACVVGMPVKDTIKVADKDQFAAHTLERNLVWGAQTPQAFSYELIKDAYEKMMLQTDIKVTDDAMVAEQFAKIPVKLILGSPYNIKITTPEDLIIAETFLNIM